MIARTSPTRIHQGPPPLPQAAPEAPVSKWGWKSKAAAAVAAVGGGLYLADPQKAHQMAAAAAKLLQGEGRVNARQHIGGGSARQDSQKAEQLIHGLIDQICRMHAVPDSHIAYCFTEVVFGSKDLEMAIKTFVQSERTGSENLARTLLTLANRSLDSNERDECRAQLQRVIPELVVGDVFPPSASEAVLPPAMYAAMSPKVRETANKVADFANDAILRMPENPLPKIAPEDRIDPMEFP